MNTNPMRWLDEELATLAQHGLRRRLLTRWGPQTATSRWGDRLLINFGSNDYLGLAASQELAAAARAAIDDVGWGSGASPLVTGRTSWHARLESELAAFEATEAALLFPSGYAANVGTIAALVGAGDVIFSDAKNHASIIDGCRLSGAKIEIFPHRDTAALATAMDRAVGFRRRLIVTDSLFSMDGDLAPLPEIVSLAEEHDAMVMVDEAHATGIFGQHGRGVCESFGHEVETRVPIRMGTLSKGLGSSGGFVAGSKALIEWLLNRTRPYVFSTAAPAAIAATGIEALRIVREDASRRERLLATAARFRDALRGDGWNVGDSASQIIPLYVGDPVLVMNWMDQLRELGCFVPGIRPPSVPAGESLLRISLTSEHTDEMLEQLRDHLRSLRG